MAENADDGVQIFGGAGFIEEYPAAQIYRDERINRIFEGTNEINRLIIGGNLLKKAILEELPIRDQIFHRMKDWMPKTDFNDNHELSKEISVIELSRSMMLYVLHELILKYGQDLKNEQWVLEPLADIVICLSVMQMGFSRYHQLENGKYKDNTASILQYSVYNNFNILKSKVKELIPVICDDANLDEAMRMIDDKLNSLSYYPDVISFKKNICEELYKKGEYYLD